MALATEAANHHTDAGADVLTGSAQMVVGAVGVAQAKGALWFGTQSNQTSLAPDIVVASQIYDWTVVLNEIIANVKDGTLGGEAFVITLANEGLVIEYNEAYAVPAEAKAAADAAIAGLVDGSISTGVGE